MIEMQHPGTYNSAAVRKGAEGAKAQFREGGRIRSEAGEAGFENLDLDKNYVTTILDETAIKNALRNNPKWRVIDLLSLGYQKGRFQLDKELADRVAEAFVLRAKNHTLTMADAVRASTDSDIASFVEKLKKAGVDQDIIDDFSETSMKKELQQHISNRAKKSLVPDISVELGDLKFIDLVDADLPKLLESYTREAAGGAAFARQLGLKTRREINDVLVDIEKSAENSNLDPVLIKREMQILKDGVDLAYGRSINKDAHGTFVRNLSRFRDLTSLLRLQFNGIASAPELARMTAQRQLSTVLEVVPELGAIRGTKNFRKGGKYSGAFNNPDLQEMDEMISFAGEDFALYPNGLRADEIEEAVSEGGSWQQRVGSYFDNAIAQGRRVQEVASGFRAIQGTGERWGVRALALDIKKWVFKDGPPISEMQLNNAGWHDGFLDEVKTWMLDNPATTKYKGKDISLMNFGEMPVSMQERLQVGIHRLVARDMLRPMVGETPIGLHKWVGQTLTQFRSFAILSMEKQLVHDIRHDRVMGAIIAMHSAMISYMALAVSSMQRHIGKDNAWEEIENDLVGTNAIAGVLGRMGQLAATGIIVDATATMGLVPEQFLQGRDQVGARAMSPGSVPVVGMAKDILEAPKAVASMLKGSDDKDRAALSSEAIKEVQDVLPFAKMIGINQTINVIKDSLNN
jgi:hypothetical protein